ncbi:MAG: phosphatase PAP2 family protein [Leptospiraceae bacterium]|nr:phosphatase PAP2 family protein [Leptospiraceae bacterium]MCP5498316.1 phosphatase PAP2 family protein [Leptospiraceae bacterium]
MKPIEQIDLACSHFINRKIKNPKLSWVLGKINKGETLGIFLLPTVFYLHPNKEGWWILLHVGLITFLTDRLVLFLKKFTARKRPLLKILESEDKNPDLKHSFPSAHAANSMVALLTLIMGYHFPFWFIFFSFFAGIGRLCTLHHFLSDVLMGWFLGFLMCFVGIYAKTLILFLL